LGNVSLNRLENVYPDATASPDTRTRGSVFIMDAWCSTCYAPTVGQLGTIFAFGGGHQNYLGNELYGYDKYTRLWSRWTNPDPIPVNSVDFDTVAGNDYGEYWLDDAHSGTTGKAAPPHTYGNFVWVPGADAGNTNGWVVLYGGFSYQVHKIDLDNPSAGWTRLGVLLNAAGATKGPSYGCTIYDGIRKRLFCIPANSGAQTFALATAIPSGTHSRPGTNYVDSYYTIGRHMVADDLYLLMAPPPGGNFVLTIHDPATGTKYESGASGGFTQTGEVPTSGPYGLGSCEWVESTRTLYYWPTNSNKVFKAAAPTNPRTGAWNWTSVTLSGVTNYTFTGATLYSRLHYDPVLDAMFIAVRTNVDVQCFQI
jgi:hypothetical protein